MAAFLCYTRLISLYNGPDGVKVCVLIIGVLEDEYVSVVVKKLVEFFGKSL